MVNKNFKEMMVELDQYSIKHLKDSGCNDMELIERIPKFTTDILEKPFNIYSNVTWVPVSVDTRLGRTNFRVLVNNSSDIVTFENDLSAIGRSHIQRILMINNVKPGSWVVKAFIKGIHKHMSIQTRDRHIVDTLNLSIPIVEILDISKQTKLDETYSLVTFLLEDDNTNRVIKEYNRLSKESVNGNSINGIMIIGGLKEDN